jgi:hypothetical protein
MTSSSSSTSTLSSTSSSSAIAYATYTAQVHLVNADDGGFNSYISTAFSSNGEYVTTQDVTEALQITFQIPLSDPNTAFVSQQNIMAVGLTMFTDIPDIGGIAGDTNDTSSFGTGSSK